MAKRSHKRPVARCKKEYPGCMGGLISMFDFRQGRSSQRLISDWRRGSGRHAVGAGYSKSRLDLPMNGDKEHTSKDVTTTSNLYERNEIKTAKIESDQTSVKALIDNEMSKVRSSVKQITRTAVQQTPPYLECRCHISNNHKQTCKSCKIASNLHLHGSRASASLDPKSSLAPSLMERPSLNEQEMHPNHTNGIDSFLACRSSTYTNKQHLQKHVVKEKLNEATESFLNQKLKDAKRLIRDGATHQSKEFMDALELLNSNKELFLKLLQDPNSLLVKHIEDLRKAQSERVSKEEMGNSMQSEKTISHKKFSKQNIHNFFRRKDKTEDRSKSPTKVSDSSFASNRIVVLKPSLESSQNSTTTRSPSSIQRSHYILRKEIESERVTTNFSIREITRKLRNAIGESRKEQHWIPTEGVCHRIPYGHQDSTEISKRITVKNQSRVETEVARKNPDFCTNTNTTAIGHSHKKGSAAYKEGETADTRTICDIHENSITRRVPRTISLPEYSKSPRFSPGRDSGPTFVHGQMRFSSPNENFRAGNESTWQQFKKEMSAESSSPWRPKLETYSFIDCSNNHREPLHVPNSDSGILKDHITDAKIHMNIGSSPKGSIVIEREADVEDSKPLVVPSKSDRVITTVDNSNAAAATDKVGADGSYEHFRMDSPERPILASTLGSFSGSPLLIHRINVPGINEKPERPSPVSVLEPFYIEGVISPASPQQASTAELAEEPQPIHHEQQESSPRITTLDPKISPRTCMEGKEEEFEYVRNVMEASGFNYSEFFGRWRSSEQPLSPSLFDQVEVSSAHLSSDRKLLFDCINEVLVEIHELFFSCSPWISFVKTNIWPIPVRKHVIQEVWQGIHWHLLPQFPRTLDQVIGKDMAKAGSWMDLRFDVEAVSSEMGEGILEKIMEEIILELWD
ncbi:hypothetical protein AAC387_Pa02g0449 [Persea americana]